MGNIKRVYMIFLKKARLYANVTREGDVRGKASRNQK